MIIPMAFPMTYHRGLVPSQWAGTKCQGAGLYTSGGAVHILQVFLVVIICTQGQRDKIENFKGRRLNFGKTFVYDEKSENKPGRHPKFEPFINNTTFKEDFISNQTRDNKTNQNTTATQSWDNQTNQTTTASQTRDNQTNQTTTASQTRDNQNNQTTTA